MQNKYTVHLYLARDFNTVMNTVKGVPCLPMDGQSAENVAVTKNIVQLNEALLANRYVFNKIMLTCVQQNLITQSSLNDLTTSESSQFSKATKFISSIQAALKNGSFYLDKFLTVLVETGDPCCKDVAINIANDYIGRDLLINYKSAIITDRTQGEYDNDIRSSSQLLDTIIDDLIVLFKRQKKNIIFVIKKFCAFLLSLLLICLPLKYVFDWHFEIIYYCAVLLYMCMSIRTNIKDCFVKNDLIICMLFIAFGSRMMNFKIKTLSEMQLLIPNNSISYTIIGGQLYTIDWLEEGFKMDIFPDSFPPDVPIDITISTHQSSNSKFQLATQMYTITSTSPSLGIVLVHLKHNLVFHHMKTTNFLLLHHGTKLLPLQNLSNYFLSSKAKLQKGFNYVCGVLNHSHIALARSKNISSAYQQVYLVSLHKKKESDYLFVSVLITFPEKELVINSKYSSWVSKRYRKKDNSYNVSLNIGDTIGIRVEPNGCWDKMESEEYKQMKTIGEYSFKLQWKCLSQPSLYDTYINVTGTNVYISTNAKSTFFTIIHYIKSIITYTDSAVFYCFKLVCTMYSICSKYTRFLFFADKNFTNTSVLLILVILNIWLAEILEIIQLLYLQWFVVLFDALIFVYLLIGLGNMEYLYDYIY